VIVRKKIWGLAPGQRVLPWPGATYVAYSKEFLRNICDPALQYTPSLTSQYNGACTVVGTSGWSSTSWDLRPEMGTPESTPSWHTLTKHQCLLKHNFCPWIHTKLQYMCVGAWDPLMKPLTKLCKGSRLITTEWILESCCCRFYRSRLLLHSRLISRKNPTHPARSHICTYMNGA